jgi:hypothetical protein
VSVSEMLLAHDEGMQATLHVPDVGQARPTKTVGAAVEEGSQSQSNGQQLASSHVLPEDAVVIAAGVIWDGGALVAAEFEALDV